MTSPVGAKTMGSSAAPVPSASMAASACLLRLDELGRALRRAPPRAPLERAARRLVELVLAPVEVGAQLVLELGQRLAAPAAATLGLLLELLRAARSRASSSTQVTMYSAK